MPLTAELDTPVLLLDMPAMEANLHCMAEFFQEGPARLRTHYKNHKCPALAHCQLVAGVAGAGITCAILREAKALVRHGVS
jgi:D-threonine aldolase